MTANSNEVVWHEVPHICCIKRDLIMANKSKLMKNSVQKMSTINYACKFKAQAFPLETFWRLNEHLRPERIKFILK